MRLIYRHFFNVSDRINYVSKARQTMWKSGIRRKAGFLAAAGLLDYALQLGVPVILVRHLTTKEFGDYRLVWLVAETGLILFPLFLPQSLFFFLPRAAPGTRPKLVGNTFASLFALGGLAILLLLGLMPREAVAAQELYETIWA